MPTILIVDDSITERRLAGGLLEMALGCKLMEATDGRDALAQMEQFLPDIVLTDLLMPGMDGLELVSAIKDEYAHVPVVLMTARGSEDIAGQALRRGAASYVPKRRLAEDLIPTVQKLLSASVEDRGHSQLMHHLTQCDSQFVLSNDLDLIQTVVSHFQQVLRCLPLRDETERLRVGVALEEALSNAYYHGNLEVRSEIEFPDRTRYDGVAEQRVFQEPYRDRRIHLHGKVSRSEATFVVGDEGHGFDHATVLAATDPNLLDQNSGRGLILMRTIMDDVTYNAAGNEVTLTIRRPVEADEPVDPNNSA